MADLMESPWPPPRRPRRLKLWFGLGAGVLALMVVAWLVRSVVLPHFVHTEIFKVNTSNMAPTIEPGSAIVITLVANGRYRPARGDIVVFKVPGSWGDPAGDLAERVIGLPGQTLNCPGDNHPLVVDGTPLAEPYARDGCGRVPYRVKVPAGRIWMLGDNRDEARDSCETYLRTGRTGPATVATTAVIAVRTKS